MDILETLLSELSDARASATMEKAGFGFSGDRIIIGPTHFAEKGREEGAKLHPDVYIKDITKLYRESWIIGPLDRAIALLKTQKELLERLDVLRRGMEAADMERIAELARAGRKQVTGY